MASHYVKLDDDGNIIEGPLPMPGGRTQSPNHRWPLSQLKAHNLLPAEMPDIDPALHVLDLDNPEIGEDKVVYKTKAKPLAERKERLLKKIENLRRRAISRKHDQNELILAGLGIGNAQAIKGSVEAELGKAQAQEQKIKAATKVSDLTGVEDEIDNIFA